MHLFAGEVERGRKIHEEKKNEGNCVDSITDVSLSSISHSSSMSPVLKC